MANRHLREAFNLIAQPLAACSDARLGYHREEANGKTTVEFQILKFSGTWADGRPFSVASERLPKGADVMSAAADTAREMLKGDTPP